VLHPRHKLDYFKGAGWEADWITTAQKIVRDEFEGSYADIELVEQEESPKQIEVRILIVFRMLKLTLRG
jgi:hypothetical protein